MKSSLFILFLSISLVGFSQNQSYNIIFDSINPQLYSGNYQKAKAIWLATEKVWNMDPQEEYLFICSSLKNNDVSFFKKRMKRLVKKSGFNFEPTDTLPSNINGYVKLFYEKEVISWLINISSKFHPKWRNKFPEASKIRREIEILIIKDQYFLTQFGPSDFADSTCDNVDKFLETMAKADFQNMAELATLCIRENGIPNHFDHGAETFYSLQLIIWHNLKTPTNRDNAWSIILPWVDKAYFEGKVGNQLYKMYDNWLFKHTGHQFYGFEDAAPLLKPETFAERKKTYGF